MKESLTQRSLRDRGGRRVSREFTRWSDGRPRTSCRAGRLALHFSAEVLPYPVFDFCQGRVQVLERVGYAEAEIAFSVFAEGGAGEAGYSDRKSTRLNSSHRCISYAVF